MTDVVTRPRIATHPSPFPAPAVVDAPRVLVVIPTYEEAATISRVLGLVRTALPDADVLVVDDGSPDGTTVIVEEVAARLGGISLLRRTTKDGLGAAYRAGFSHGLALGYDVLVEMDADLSHDPAALPELVGAVVRDGADLAIGSRYVPGGEIPVWSRRRRALSRFGNRYAAAVLGDDIADLTSGFRAYRAGTIERAGILDTGASGYAFQIESAHRVVAAGLTVREVPISFVDRTEGTSKMSWRIPAEAMARVTWWGLRDRMAGDAR